MLFIDGKTGGGGGEGFIPPLTRVVYVDKGRLDVYVEDGSLLKPYKAIQSAINYIASVAVALQDWTIYINTGQYQENLVLESATLYMLSFEGIGVVGIIPVSGNALQSTSNNANLSKLYARNIEFAKPVVITGVNAGTMFNVTWFENCKFVTTATITANCINNLSIVHSYVETAISLTNVTWFYSDSQQLQGAFDFICDSTANAPANGYDCTCLLIGNYNISALTFTKGGTANGVFAMVGSRVNSSSGTITIPSGWIVQAYDTFIRGNVVNNGTLILRGGFVEKTLTNNGTLTLDQPSSQIKNDSNVSGVTVKDALNSLLAPQQETVAKNIYIATTGSDITGDGTIGLPFFSIQKALDSTKEYFNGVEVAILAVDGIYDYSALGNLIVNKKVIKGALFSGKLRIRPQSAMADAFTVLDTGTFDSQTDTELTTHICTGKAWTPNAYVGKFLRIITMNSGSMPSNGDGVNYTFRIIPIVRNGADWIETGFVYNTGSIQNIGQFEIVEQKVVFNFGANGVYVTDDVFGGYVFNMIKMVSTSHIMFNQSTNEFVADIPFQLITYNSAYVGYFVYSKMAVMGACYVEASGSMGLGVSDASVFNTTYNFSYGRITLFAYQRNAVFINTSAGTAGSLCYISGYIKASFMSFVWNVKFINCDIAIEGASSFDIPAKIQLDSINWFLNLTGKYDVKIYDGNAGYYSWKNEPREGRVTYDDGVTIAKEFHDLDFNFNIEVLSKSARQVDYASQLKNDSLISGGATIKDALNRVQEVTVPCGALSGIQRITVSFIEPVSKNIGDLWFQLQ